MACALSNVPIAIPRALASVNRIFCSRIGKHVPVRIDRNVDVARLDLDDIDGMLG